MLRVGLDMKRNPTLSILGVLLLSPALVLAHPGHDLHHANWSHLLTSPDHVAALGLTGVVLLALGWFVQDRLPRRVLRCAGVTALAAAAVLLVARA